MTEPLQLPLFPDQAALTRIRPERNEWRYYRMAVWPDLFGRALLAPTGVASALRAASVSILTQMPAPPSMRSPGSPMPSDTAAIGIRPRDGAPEKARQPDEDGEGSALALPPGPRRPWTRHPEGTPPLSHCRHAALHRRWR